MTDTEQLIEIAKLNTEALKLQQQAINELEKSVEVLIAGMEILKNDMYNPKY